MSLIKLPRIQISIRLCTLRKDVIISDNDLGQAKFNCHCMQ